MTVVLDVRDMCVTAAARSGDERTTLDGVSVTVKAGEIVGVVGETGAGKSVLVRSILGLFGENERWAGGEVLFGERSLPLGDDEAMRIVRGADIALVQSGSRARLNPVERIGRQIVEIIRVHRGLSKSEATARARALLDDVGMPDSAHQMEAYPHQHSGGMCQRVLIAMALANNPRLLLADEPTAGLDVTIQRQILDLFRTLVRETGAGSLLATNDLGIVAHYCDRVLVLANGKVVEVDDVPSFVAGPREEYSRRLLALAALAHGEGGRMRRRGIVSGKPVEPVIEVRDAVKHFRTPSGVVHAINGVSFDVFPGETLALVGESGSGKTTMGRCVVGLEALTSGAVLLNGTPVGGRGAEAKSASSLVFQEPRESLNPRWPVSRAIAEPLRYGRRLSAPEVQDRVARMLDRVRLPQHYGTLYPHNLTAGEQQRVAIARALIGDPVLAVLDEPTTALDLSVRAEMVALLTELQEETGVAYLFISHDMTTVKLISHRIAVMYLGNVIETGATADIFREQVHPYGRALLASVLYPEISDDDDRFRLEGEIPSALEPPRGCALSTRCPLAQEHCTAARPGLEDAPDRVDRLVACFRTDEIVESGGPAELAAQDEARRSVAQGSA